MLAGSAVMVYPIIAFAVPLLGASDTELEPVRGTTVGMRAAMIGAFGGATAVGLAQLAPPGRDGAPPALAHEAVASRGPA